jgi:hypothetical protein
MDEVEKAKQNNLDVFLEQGPRLSYRYKTWVVARDRKDGWVLLGGLGGLGVGEMWSKEVEDHKNYPGYEDAPERSSVGGFGREPLNIDKILKNVNISVGVTGFKGDNK